MFTQTIKRWFSRLFAWWPWGKSSVTGYSQTRGINTAMPSEQLWRTTMEGPATQPGASSVAVEHDEPDLSRLTTDERSERQALPQDEHHNSSSRLPAIRGSDTPAPAPPQLSSELSPAIQQQRRLEFLRYLVQRGIVNEDFPQGQAPEQYRSPQP